MSAIEIAEYIGLCAWILSHLVAVFGLPTWMPESIGVLINRLSANYGKAANK
jgi:hypothetical protein